MGTFKQAQRNYDNMEEPHNPLDDFCHCMNGCECETEECKCETEACECEPEGYDGD